MQRYKVDYQNKWEFENGFYLTCETGRIGKLLNHYELYKQLESVQGDIYEFGVYKGASLVRLASFRELCETTTHRKIYGFDVFGKFPDELALESDLEFVQRFEQAGGNGISEADLQEVFKRKEITNIELIAGDLFDTLPKHIEKIDKPKIALLHVDVDVYEPTKYILESLWEFIEPGGIVMLDDYKMVEGGTIAIDEFLSDKKEEVRTCKFYKAPHYLVKDN